MLDNEEIRMLLVVFGAGASYDSVESFPQEQHPLRPPLAKDLFDQRELFVDIASYFHQISPILPLLRPRNGNVSVEQELQRLQADAASYSKRHSQLAAVRYYLHYCLWRISQEWQQKVVRGRGSNYHTLLDKIAQHRRADDAVALVTFNYDTLLEDAVLPVLGRTDTLVDFTLDDYIKHDYKIFKLHGSVNWAHPIETPAPPAFGFWDTLSYLIDLAPKLKISDEIEIIKNHLLEGLPLLYPAIALPLQEKNDYECPPDHVETLRTVLPRVSRMLIVGWRAMEAHFLRDLAQALPRQVKGLVVSRSPEGATETIERLGNAGIDVSDFHPAQSGFSDSVLGSAIDAFLR
jgi:hypothetical protein